MEFDVSEAIGRAWEEDSTLVVSMFKSWDWVKAIAEKRATLMTSLTCISEVG